MVERIVLSNFMWVPVSAVEGTPTVWAPEWEYRIPFLASSDGKHLQKEIQFLREMALIEGLNPDDVIQQISSTEELVLRNWSKPTPQWYALSLGNRKKVNRLIKRLGLPVEDRRIQAPWGPELADLKLMAQPRDYQHEALAAWIKADHGILEAAPAYGKAQPVDEVVLTPSGWQPIGELKVGDQVIGSDGRPCAVTGVFPQGQRPVRILRFSDGASVRADVDHLWAVKNSSDLRRNRPWRTLTTQQIQETLLEPCGESRWRVPLVEVQEEDKDLPLDPYVLGVLIGDGCFAEYLSSPLLTSEDDEVVEAVNLRLPDGFRCGPVRSMGGRAPSYRISRPRGECSGATSQVKETLRHLGLWGCLSYTKFIPPAYLAGSAQQRRELLMGLMDTDGWTKGSQLSTASEQLALGVVQLVRSLGGTARLTEKTTSYSYRGEMRDGRAAHMVTMKLSFTPFRLSRKIAVYERRRRTPPCRKIVAVEDAGTAECVCISVDAPDHLYVTHDYVVTHNTFVGIATLMAQRQRTLVLVPTDNLAGQFIDRFRKGSPNPGGDGFLPYTNCEEMEDRLGTPVIKRLRTAEDLAPINVATWQTFLSESGQQLLKKLSKQYGVVMCDEAHVFAAPRPSQVINSFHAKCKRGMSVGKDSWVELKGGPFGIGWIGPIEEAYNIVCRQFHEVEIEDHQVVIPEEEIWGRGWGGSTFEWKLVRRFIRHVSPDNVTELKISGEWLRATHDHSVYVVEGTTPPPYRSPIFVEHPAHKVSVGAVTAADDGAGWDCGQAPERLLNVVDIVRENAFVAVDALIASHRKYALTNVVKEQHARCWWNYKNQSARGPYVPLSAWKQHREFLPPPKEIFVGQGSLPSTIAPTGLAFLLGFYLGNGWCDGHQVCWSIKTSDVEEITTYLKKGLSSILGPDVSFSVSPRRGSSEISLNHCLMADVIKHLIPGHAITKRIPAEWIINWPTSARRSLLAGMLRSDGHEQIKARGNYRCSYSTSSAGLARDLLSLLRSLGLRGNLGMRKACPGGVINGDQIIGHHDNYIISWNGHEMVGNTGKHRGHKKAFDHHNMQFNEARVRDVRQYHAPEQAFVYDLEMDGHPSFTANGILVHNSGTPARKDLLEAALYDIVGPITAVGKAEQVPIEAYFIQTDSEHPASKYPKRSDFTYLVTALAKDDERTDLIMEWAKRDVSQGRNILILTDRRNWGIETASRLTNEMEVRARCVLGGMTSKRGTAERDKVIAQMMSGDINVILATQVFKLGLDIPVLDTLYITVPMSNAPQLRQMLGRVRRRYPGKDHVVVRYFVDSGHGLIYGCMKSTHKALVAEGAEIHFIHKGTIPSEYKVVPDEQSLLTPHVKTTGLRAIASKLPSAVETLFKELKSQNRSKR